MKSLYITSVEPHSGKTATCLAIARRLQNEGHCVRYLKPLSLQPYRVAGKLADEDAAFAKEVLHLEEEPWQLSPVVVTSDVLRKFIGTDKQEDLMAHVKAECERVIEGCEILMLEGGGSLREGYIMGLPTIHVATTLGSKVLAIVRYHSDVQLLDDALATRTRLREALLGVIMNRVPAEAMNFIDEMARPYLEKNGVAVYAVLPEARGLEALTVQEIIDTLNADVLTAKYNSEALVEHLTVGAMTAEAALHRFRQQVNKAVITGGDRTDIQLAALETSTTCLILTGNLRPSPLIIKQADQFGVPVLLVRENTLETVEALEKVFGKTRLGQASKLQQFEELLAAHVNWKRLYQALEL
jgi:BioD-like phosphotransacetylase family protein